MKESRITRTVGIYTCGSCGKKTRETGEGESLVGLCLACYEEGGLINEHSDGLHDGAPVPGCPDCAKETE